MAISVRLDPLLEARLAEEARRRGVSKSEIIKEALERALNQPNPYELLLKVRNPAAYSVAEPTTSVSENTGARFKALIAGKNA